MKRLFDYDDWANRAEVDHLRALPDPPKRAIDLLAHIVGTQWLWYSRIRGESSPMMVWPSLTLDEIAAQLDQLRMLWRQAPDRESITYTNSKGEPWTSRVDDVLHHVILHGSYHRGQIALIVRDGGAEPAYTDYIECTRRGWI